MMKINRIYLDIDGVLNTMPFSALFKILGCNGLKYPIGEYDIVKVCNQFLTTPLTAEQFWSQLDYDFWATISKSAECDWLIEFSRQMVGEENVFLLTSPIRNPQCVAGKIDWIYNTLPKWLHNQFIITRHKEVCAHPNELLIDDCDENIKTFSKAGGEVILMPRPWNSYSN